MISALDISYVYQASKQAWMHLEYCSPAHNRKPIPEYLVHPSGPKVPQEQVQSKEHARAQNGEQPRVARRNLLLQDLILLVGIPVSVLFISVLVSLARRQRPYRSTVHRCARERDETAVAYRQIQRIGWCGWCGREGLEEIE